MISLIVCLHCQNPSRAPTTNLLLANRNPHSPNLRARPVIHRKPLSLATGLQTRQAQQRPLALRQLSFDVLIQNSLVALNLPDKEPAKRL